jgi:hypothetical protein
MRKMDGRRGDRNDQPIGGSSQKSGWPEDGIRSGSGRQKILRSREEQLARVWLRKMTNLSCQKAEREENLQFRVID